MNEFIKRNSPPGIRLKEEYRVFLIGNITAVGISFFGFLATYLRARETLFTYQDGRRVLIDGAVIAPFPTMVIFYFPAFFFVALLMLGFILYHYSHYRQGSMSIYLMKRLPNRWELHRRALTLPCLAVLAVLAVAAATMLICFLIYLIATPKVCLPYETLLEIWR